MTDFTFSAITEKTVLHVLLSDVLLINSMVPLFAGLTVQTRHRRGLATGLKSLCVNHLVATRPSESSGDLMGVDL